MSECVYACVSAAYNIATIIFVQASFQQLGASQMFLIPKRFLFTLWDGGLFFYSMAPPQSQIFHAIPPASSPNWPV